MMLLPKDVGPFTLVRKLGTGTIAESYLGTLSRDDGRPVVVRRILPFVLRDAGRLASTEARVRDLIGVRHPFLVQVLDWVEHGGERFIVESRVDGVDLERVLSWCRQTGNRIPPNVFLNLATQICNGLEALHGRTGRGSGAESVLHLGLRPGAILVGREGKVVLGGFGLTRSPMALSHGGPGSPVPLRMEYLSPEQTQADQRLSPASDIFSLGAVLYELLTLEPLFKSDSNLQTVHRIRKAEVTEQLLQVKDLMPGLDKILYRALALDPRHRYQRAFVLREDLRGLMAGYSFSSILDDARDFFGPLIQDAPDVAAPSPITAAPAAAPPQHDDFEDEEATRIDRMPESPAPGQVDPSSTAALAASAVAAHVAAEQAKADAAERAYDAAAAYEGADLDGGHDEIPGPSRAIHDEEEELADRATLPVPPAASAVPPSPVAIAIADEERTDLGGVAVPPGVDAASTRAFLRGEAELPSAPPAPPPVVAAPVPSAPPPAAPRVATPRGADLPGVAAPRAAAPPPPVSAAPPPVAAAPTPPAPTPPAPTPPAPTPAVAAPQPVAPQPAPQAAPAAASPPAAPPPAVADDLDDLDYKPRSNTLLYVAAGVALMVVVCGGGGLWAVRTLQQKTDEAFSQVADALDEAAAAEAAAAGAAAEGLAALDEEPEAEVGAGGGPRAAAAEAPAAEAPAAEASEEPAYEEPAYEEPAYEPPAREVAAAPARTESRPGGGTSSGSASSGRTESSASRPSSSRPAASRPSYSAPEPVADLATDDGPSGDDDGSADISPAELEEYADAASKGRLGASDVLSLERVSPADSGFTRSRALLLMHAQAKGDERAASHYLDELMARPENKYNPVYLSAQARIDVNHKRYDRALERARLAERHWARLPPDLVFSKKAEIYETQAAALQGAFYASGSDMELLDDAVKHWKKYRDHVQTRSRGDLARRADAEIAKLEDIRRRLQ